MFRYTVQALYLDTLVVVKERLGHDLSGQSSGTCVKMSMYLQTMQKSPMVEISPDQLYVRTKEDPEKWPIEGPDIHLSSLKADVPEFVPGKMYQQTGKVL